MVSEERIREILNREISKVLFTNESLDNHLYLDFSNKNYKVNLKEGQYKTYPPLTALRYIKNLFMMDDSQIRIVDGIRDVPEEKRLWVVYYDVYDNKKKMEKAMLYCGYTLSKEEIRNDDVIEQIYIPINLPNLDDIVRKYDFITHITPVYNRDKILRMGFVPKNKNEMFSYTDRVFFFKGDTPYEEILYQAIKFDEGLENKRNEHVYTIFLIDTKKIPNYVSFHTDLTYPCGIYTTENVPPTVIKQHKDFNVEELAHQYFGLE